VPLPSGPGLDGATRPVDASSVRVRGVLIGSLLLPAACDLQCSCDAQSSSSIQVGLEGERKVEVVEVERKLEVEIERTICDDLGLEVEKIVLVPANPPFHADPIERVSIRITNGGAEAVEVSSGTQATFLDERRTIIEADLHQSEWFMPLTLPAKSSVVVQIVVPQHAGKALRSVEVEAEPADRPFSECKVVDDLLEAMPAAVGPAEAEPI
jgi:hypothetical protein